MNCFIQCTYYYKRIDIRVFKKYGNGIISVLTPLQAYQYFNKIELSYKCNQMNGECISISNNSTITQQERETCTGH
jgi:hypothetical protein